MPTKAPSKGPRDFGGTRRYGMASVIGVVVVISLGTAYVLYEFLHARHDNMATASAWDIKGPPCAQLTLDQWNAKHLKVHEVFDYDGTKLGRWSGDANCNDVHTGGGAGLGVDKVCQFTNPTVLTVSSPAGIFYFDTGIGQPATLSIHKDVPKCVLASKYTRATE